MNKKISLILLLSLCNTYVFSAAPKIGKLAKLWNRTKLAAAFGAGYYINMQDTENLLGKFFSNLTESGLENINHLIEITKKESTPKYDVNAFWKNINDRAAHLNDTQKNSDTTESTTNNNENKKENNICQNQQ